MRKVQLKNGLVMEIDKAKPQDAQALIDYCNRIGGQSDNLTFGLNEFRVNVEDEVNLINSMDKGGLVQIFCGKVNGVILANASAGMSPKARMCHRAGIGITVDDSIWGQGAGKALMQYLLDYLKCRGDIKIVYLEVRSDNLNAIKLYEKLGFVKVGNHKDFLYVNEKYYDVDAMELYF